MYSGLPIHIKLDIIISYNVISLEKSLTHQVGNYFGYFRGDSDRRPYLFAIPCNSITFFRLYGKAITKKHYIIFYTSNEHINKYQKILHICKEFSSRCKMQLIESSPDESVSFSLIANLLSKYIPVTVVHVDVINNRPLLDLNVQH